MPSHCKSWITALLLSLAVSAESAHAQAQRSYPRAPARPTAQADTTALPANSHPPVRESRRPAAEAGDRDKSRYGEPIKLPSRQALAAGEPGATDAERTRRGSGVLPVVLSSLAIVLGLFFLLAWVARRALPKSTTLLPNDVLEVLGHAPLAGRHSLQLVRLGRRLLLVSVTADRIETLSEVSDTDEVNHLCGLCRQQEANSISGSFRGVLHQLGNQPSGRSRFARSAAAEREQSGTARRKAATARGPLREIS